MNLVISPPSEKQKLFLTATAKNVGFGGARGGGKSWAVRVKALQLALRHCGIKIVIIRKTYPELTENHIKPLKKMLYIGDRQKQLAKYNDRDKEIRFKNGSTILFRYCDTEKDVDRLQGLEVDVAFIDEATQISESQKNAITAIVRGTNNFPKRIYYTCNPGGVGHGWVKRLFIDRQFIENENPDDYVFIQSFVTDNKVLMEADPQYYKSLLALPPKMKKAWLYGQWDVFDGAYFEEFRAVPDTIKCQEAGLSTEEAAAVHKWTHVIEPFQIPESWKIYRSYDWGYGKPFAVEYFALSPDDVLYNIAEIYGMMPNQPNEGIKWTNSEQCAEIRNLEDQHPLLKCRKIHGIADPSVWDGSHGTSFIDEADKYKLYFEKGMNNRIDGWMQVRGRMRFDSNGRSKLYFFNTCKNMIRTIPLMMYDEIRTEDLNTDLEDHACDTLRYMCAAKPLPPQDIPCKIKPMFDPLNQYGG